MIGEIAVLPLVFGLWQVAIIFSLLNAAIWPSASAPKTAPSDPDSSSCDLAGRAYMAATLLDIVKALRLGPEGLGTERLWNLIGACLTDTAAIARLIEPAVKELGFDLVRVAMIGGTSDPTLQVMAERPDTRQLTIDDCADISRKLSDLLDEADPIRSRPTGWSQFAGHRPAADPPCRLCRLGRA